MVVPDFIVFSFYYKGKCIKTLPTMLWTKIEGKHSRYQYDYDYGKKNKMSKSQQVLKDAG